MSGSNTCDHRPSLCREYQKDRVMRERVHCRLCGIGTGWLDVYPGQRNLAWDAWAVLMAQASAAAHEAKDAEAERGQAAQAAPDAASYAAATCFGLVESLVADGLVSSTQSVGAIVREARAALIFRKNAKRLLTQKEFGAIATGHHPFGKLSDRADAEIERIVKEAVERTTERLRKRADEAVGKVVAAGESVFATVDKATKNRPCRHGIYGNCHYCVLSGAV